MRKKQVILPATVAGISLAAFVFLQAGDLPRTPGARELALAGIILLLLACLVSCIAIITRQEKTAAIKNDFINNMTHEFKNPLATISLASQMLKDEELTRVPGTTGRVASIIHDESKRLTDQVERVLQMALFTENRVRLELENVKVNDTIRHLLPRLAPVPSAKIASHFQTPSYETIRNPMTLANCVASGSHDKLVR